MEQILASGMRRRWLSRLGLALVVSGVGAVTPACGGSGPRVGVLVPDGAASFPLMHFGEPFDLDALPEGWHHRGFLRHPPMQLSFVERDGRDAIRLATHDSTRTGST